MKPIRILVADAHEVARRGVTALLAGHPGWEVCAEATTGREAVTKAKELKPDVVVLDITMPELNGFEASTAIRQALPEARVLILTVHESAQVASEIIRAGAHGYVLKSDAGQDLIAAVRALSEHKPYFTSKAAEMMWQHLRPGEPALAEPSDSATPLTEREREIVQLLARGRRNKEVADALSISVKTVETHRANIMHKLGLASTAELVRYAIRISLVQP